MLVDGEHSPPVVRAAIARLASRRRPCHVVGAAFLGGTEKVPAGAPPDLGVPAVDGATPADALAAGLARFAPDLVVDLADDPVVDARTRMGLAARTLAAGIPYEGAGFRFDPPPRPRLARKPAVAVIGTGKRTGKTAVAAALARLLRERGDPPVIVTMGRGGPPEPEVVDPACDDLTPAGLLARADAGRHAASDHLEDALTAGVVTIGTSRCGGGLAGAPADDTFAAGVALANGRPERLLVLEGSGQAIPPAHADATVCVVPAAAAGDVELLTGYLGSYRLLLADLIIVTMAGTPLAVSGASSALDVVKSSVRGLAPGGRVVATAFRPTPLEPISGRRIFYATTAPAPTAAALAQHLEREHGCEVVGVTSHLADRRLLAADLGAMERAEVLVTELKAAAVDLAARAFLERGREVVFCDNRIVAVGGDGDFDDLALAAADLSISRFSQ